MKKMVLFSMLVAGLVSGADAAAPVQQRRGAPAAAATNAAPVASARAAARTPAQTAARASAVSARSGTTPVSAARSGATPTSAPVVSARAAATQKVIGTTTKVQVAATNTVVSEACREKYQGCMDSFCMIENSSGGRCGCSARGAELDKTWNDIQAMDAKAYKMATEGVEKIEMGSDANEVLANVNEITKGIMEEGTATDELKKNTRQPLSFSSVWNSIDAEEDDLFAASTLVSPVDGKTGDALHSAASDLCLAQIPECGSELSMLKLVYTQTIKSDCTAYENELKRQQLAVSEKVATAERALRDAALESLRSANKWDLGQCTVEFKKCMSTTAGCKDDFTGCVGIAAATNAKAGARQNASMKMVDIKGSNTKISVAASTMDALESKRPLCETVMNSCTRVRDQVWTTFLREVGPQIKSAELLAESDLRTSCISNISACFQKACKDTIDPNNPDGSYDLCLTRPETVASLCKVSIEPCAAAEPAILDFVYARLAGMRVDVCTESVKSLLQRDTNCGEDYSQCMGLDRAAITQLISTDSLVACQENGKKKSMDDLEDIVMGIMLGIDNSLMAACDAAVQGKMEEICGDVANCEMAFENDKLFGSDGMAINMASADELHIIGLLDFGALGNSLKPTTTTADTKTTTTSLADVLKNWDSESKYKPNNNSGTYLGVSRSNAQNIVNKINSVVGMLSSDERIRQCTQGRNMSQIRGADAGVTEERFPNLLDGYVSTIVDSALAVAKNNHDAKKSSLLKEAVNRMNEIQTAAGDISGGMCYDKRVFGELDFAK